MDIAPTISDVRPQSIAIVGFEDGAAGQIQSFMEAHGMAHVACFVNPFPNPPDIPEAIKAKTESRIFDWPTPDSFKGRPLITSSRWPAILKKAGIGRVIVTMVDKDARRRYLNTARAEGLTLVNAIHPSAVILDEARIGESVVVLARAVIGYRAEIEDGAYIQIGTQIDHHCIVRQCATIGPAAIVAGNVIVGECAHLYTGVSVAPRVRIGARAVVGAGAVVIRDVPDGVTVAGVPARPIESSFE